MNSLNSDAKSRKRSWRRKLLTPQLQQEQSDQVEAALLNVINATYVELFGPTYSKLKPFELALKIGVNPTATGFELTMRAPIRQQIADALKELEQRSGAYQPGRVYCYRCETSSCEHAGPPSSTCVFGGYSYHGVPQWPELFQFLLARKDERVDRLFKPYYETLVSVVRGRDLKQKLLHQFGKSSKTYDVLYQLVAGYLPLQTKIVDIVGYEFVAVTIQAVESRNLNGGIRLDLNVVGNSSKGDAIMDLLAESEYGRVHELIIDVRRRLKEIERLLGKESARGDQHLKSQMLRTVPLMMNELAEAIEQRGRQRNRRTRHAEDRVNDNRPVVAATEDAKRVVPDRILVDEYEKTFVIWGPKQRIHIFTFEGVHITSMKLGADIVRNRIKRKRWRLATLPETIKFRNHFSAKLLGEEAEQ